MGRRLRRKVVHTQFWRFGDKLQRQENRKTNRRINPGELASLMTASETISGDEAAVATSPNNKLKFLCSYGGKILARPGESKLKYVGGETRVVAVPRDIKFSELVKKLNTLVEGDMIFKYQVIPEELDALVTVRTDEDLKHMVDEYNRIETVGSPKLRTFLFPSKPVIVQNRMNYLDPHAIEQRYINAVNGIVRSNSNPSSGRATPVHSVANHPIISISGSSSPNSTSPEGKCKIIDSLPFDSPAYHPNTNCIPKVQSSSSLNTINTQTNNHSNAKVHHPNHVCHRNHQLVQPYSVQYSRPHQDFRTERPKMVAYELGRDLMGHFQLPSNHLARFKWGNGCCKSYYDESLVYEGAKMIRAGGVPAGRIETTFGPKYHICGENGK